MDETVKYPEGNFLGIWMAVCIGILTAIWIPLSILTGNLALIGVGPAMGVAVGLAVGQIVEHKQRKEGKIRPLNESEKRIRKVAVVVGIIIALMGCFLFLVGLL